jgi:hypothetical protein
MRRRICLQRSLLLVPIGFLALNLYFFETKVVKNFRGSMTSAQSHADSEPENALPPCNSLSDDEFHDNFPLAFYCQRRSGLTEFPSGAALNAWRDVQNFITHDLAIKILKRSQKYTSLALNMTLWSTHDDEGALLVLEEGAGNTYDLTGDSSEGLAVDIGSNLGAVTIGIARHYPFWTVLSAEAMPITFLYLIANLWLNEPAAMAARRIVPAFAPPAPRGEPHLLPRLEPRLRMDPHHRQPYCTHRLLILTPPRCETQPNRDLAAQARL